MVRRGGHQAHGWWACCVTDLLERERVRVELLHDVRARLALIVRGEDLNQPYDVRVAEVAPVPQTQCTRHSEKSTVHGWQ